MTPLYARLSGALLLLLLVAVPAQAADTVPIDVVDGAVVWTPAAPFAQAMLTLSSPSGLEYRRAFGAGEVVRLHPSEMGDVPLADGFYEYRLLLAATFPDADEPVEAKSLTGTIEVRDGQAVDSPLLDFVINDDLIVTFSACIGNDCVNGEVFGFDTLRLKENNLRLHFLDTSSTSSFPSNDWRIRINDSTNGGANYFAIEDATAGRTPFRVEAGARENALVVESDGDVGIGTINPVTELHIVRGDTPTVRLDQDGSSGFTPQVWDMAGNETNFFVRDVTNGSSLPFRIRPGASSSALFIDSDDDIGLGTSSPDSRLHLRGAFGGNALKNTLRIEDTTDGKDLFTINGDGLVTFGFAGASATSDAVLFRNETTNEELISIDGEGDLQALGNLQSLKQIRVDKDFTAVPGIGFRIRDTGTGLVNFQVAGTGEVTSLADMNAVAFNATSDVNRKENIAPVDVDAVLAGVVGMPIATWEFIGDDENALHLGPMAQDFAAAFGLGTNDTQIATVDADGVALASIQALHARVEAAAARIAELDAVNARLLEENAQLEARLARIEALLGTDHE